jgi:1-deoxy-D-xylulose-5-phosphate reductoisomerase
VIESVCILGATGSIGLSTLNVISAHPDRYSVFALSANKDWSALLDLCLQFNPEYAVLVDIAAKDLLEAELAKDSSSKTIVLGGADALSTIASHNDVNTVMAAIVGAAGLEPTLAAVRAGKKVLLANKESLVLAGSLFMDAVKMHQAVLLPIDSEHNAIFQCLSKDYRCGESTGREVEKVLLTASGGPFRGYSAEQLKSVTIEQACNHPNWSMGRKISIDSASLMNKGLELIEACWLFDLTPDDIEVHIHPESIVHSMVAYNDGSILAQLGQPDMRTPIAYGLAWPERISSGVERLDLFKVASLNFEKPDEQAFPCLRLAKEAFQRGGSSCAYLNAANEEAVSAFLKGNISFADIPDIIERVLSQASLEPLISIQDVLDADAKARRVSSDVIAEAAAKFTTHQC